MGLTFAPAIAAATAGITGGDAGVASAMVNTTQQIGGAVGTAALSTIFASSMTRYMSSHLPPTPALRPAAAIHGYTVAFTWGLGALLLAAVLSFVLVTKQRRAPLGGATTAAGETTFEHAEELDAIV